MDKVVRNITSQKKYKSKFDQNIHSDFKKIAKNNNRSISWYLNIKIKELKKDINLKKYEENDNYKGKLIFLKEDIHKFVKRESYLQDITMRDYLQSVMEKVIKNNISS